MYERVIIGYVFTSGRVRKNRELFFKPEPCTFCRLSDSGSGKSTYLALINRAGGLYGRILTEVVSTDRTQ